MRHLVVPTAILSLVLGCSGSDQQAPPPQTPAQQTPIPAAAATMDSKLTTGMAKHISRVPRFEGILVGIFNPGTPLAQGVSLTPDNSPGAQPHSFTFSGPYDGNGDGFQETTRPDMRRSTAIRMSPGPGRRGRPHWMSPFRLSATSIMPLLTSRLPLPSEWYPERERSPTLSPAMSRR